MGCSIGIKREKRKHPAVVAMEQMDALLAEAEKNLSESERIQGELGINRKAVQQFIELPDFAEADRAKAKKALAEWEVELDRDAKTAADEARKRLGRRGGAKAPKPSKAALRRTRV